MHIYKNKVFWLISFLLIFGFLFTSFSSYFISKKILIKQIEDVELPMIDNIVYSEIERDLEESIIISLSMAKNSFLQKWMLKGEENIDQITEFLNSTANVYKCDSTFLISTKTQKYYHFNGVLKTLSKDSKKDQWFYEFLKTDKEYDFSIDADESNNNKKTLFVDYKVYDQDLNVIGVTGIGMTIKHMQSIMHSYKQKLQADMHIVSDKGEIVLSSSEEYLNKNVNEIEEIKPFVKKMFLKEKQNFLYKKEGKIIHFHSIYLKYTNGYLLVQKDEEKAIKDIKQTLFFNLVFCILISSLILIVTRNMMLSYNNKIEKIASTDQLTKAYNRYVAEILLNENVKHFQRTKKTFSIIIFDIDDFKQVNDSYGHLKGDYVLKELTKITKKIMRKSDMLCRWGGEEFLILLKECDKDNALKMSEKIRTTINQHKFNETDTEIRITISLGVSEFTENLSLDDLLSLADKALYYSKNSGKNRSSSI